MIIENLVYAPHVKFIYNFDRSLFVFRSLFVSLGRNLPWTEELNCKFPLHSSITSQKKTQKIHGIIKTTLKGWIKVEQIHNEIKKIKQLPAMTVICFMCDCFYLFIFQLQDRSETIVQNGSPHCDLTRVEMLSRIQRNSLCRR